MVGGKNLTDRLTDFHSGKEFKSYEIFGCHKADNGAYTFRVWAPHAEEVALCLFSDGEKLQLAMHRCADSESFEVEVRAQEGDKYFFLFTTADGRQLEKADPYAFRSDLPRSFYSVVCDIPEPSEYAPPFNQSDKNRPINVYEVNLLSWKRHADNGYYTYNELAEELVPYVKEMGYTHVEFMPVTEFPFDGSWGYQVTGYFAVTSRLGTPADFKTLIDAFHSSGIKVILDFVPAHFPKDDWGLYEFDGQPLYECPLWDRMEHGGWGTRRFDFGRAEIDNFLISSAYFLLDKFRVDGLRVDAVASMIYLDYDRATGDFTPNVYGDSRNLEGIEFIKKFNSAIKRDFPWVLTFAEESTAFPMVTGKVENGGLGFDFKWNMGWMNDVLFYCRQDPYFRNHHHNKITFSLVYAFSENFILPLSHDEVVHVKGSIVNKMSGEYEDKFAGERILLAFMFAHPGKKLNFMGYEVAQFKEWNYNAGIDLFLADEFPLHRKMREFVKNLNFYYRDCKALYEIDYSWDGFEWLVVDDNYHNLLAFSRYSKNGESLTCIINFSGVELTQYPIGVDEGKYRIVLNTDEIRFGGTGKLRKKVFSTSKASGSKRFSIQIDIPRLTCIYLIKEK